MKKSKRSDIHRPGELDPTQYQEILAFAYPAGGFPGHNLDYLQSMRTGLPVRMHQGGLTPDLFVDEAGKPKMVDHGKKESFFQGGNGGCDVCGATFIEGSVFKHVPTGECIIVGHICAEKIGFESDTEEWVKIRGMRKAASLRVRDRRNRWAGYRLILADKELRRLLRLDHRIAKEMRDTVRSKGWRPTDKQIELLRKLERDLSAPPEVHVPAPIADGRQDVEGVIVSAKWQESTYGDTLKITVKVATLEGTWLAWGTCPSQLLTDANAEGAKSWLSGIDVLRNSTVRFTAKLQQGRDPHFAIFSRPTCGVLVQTHGKVAARILERAKLEAELKVACDALDAAKSLEIGQKLQAMRNEYR